MTDPDGHTTTLTFNWMSHPTGEVDATGGTTTTTYNSQGFPVDRDRPDGPDRSPTPMTRPATSPRSPSRTRGPAAARTTATATETITYDDAYGVPTSITDFNGNTTTFVLDSHGNVLEEEQPGGVDQEWTYNSGRPGADLYRRQRGHHDLHL